MKLFLFSVLLGAAFLVTPTAAEACSRKIPANAEQTIVPAKRINQKLLDAAVRAEVNYHRCRAGLPKLGSAGGGMAGMAETHSAWMAKTQQLTHRNTIPGKVSLSQRVQRAGVKARTGSENIGVVNRYQIDGLSFRIIDRQTCQFATKSGQPLPAHSYASLARHIVNLWMNSPSHRKNILDPKVTKVNTAVAFDPRADYCGRYWLTQNFIG